MIVSQITSGLGNQLFQYAYGRYLAIKNDTELLLYPSGYENNYIGRKFLLNEFNINADVIAADVVNSYLKTDFVSKLSNKIFRKPLMLTKYAEPSWSFNPGAVEMGNNTFITGYWQSEKYFKPAEAVIRKELTLKKELSSSSQQYQQLIKQQSNAVSLHIRRGDYAHHPLIAQSHGVLPLSYYHEAIKYLTEKLGAINLFIFSDDIKWVKENLSTGLPTTYITGNDEEFCYEDMMLMASCQHHIIANSSFSWWGAWLNGSTNKIVIAPSKWFNDPAKVNNDILPESWIKLWGND